MVKVKTNDFDKKLGTKLKYLRLQKGLTQTQFGDKIGVSFQQIQKYEQGKNRLTVYCLHQIMSSIDIGVEYFFDNLSQQTTSHNTNKNSLNMLRLFNKIEDDKLKSTIVSFVKIFTSHSRA